MQNRVVRERLPEMIFEQSLEKARSMLFNDGKTIHRAEKSVPRGGTMPGCLRNHKVSEKHGQLWEKEWGSKNLCSSHAKFIY